MRKLSWNRIVGHGFIDDRILMLEISDDDHERREHHTVWIGDRIVTGQDSSLPDSLISG